MLIDQGLQVGLMACNKMTAVESKIQNAWMGSDLNISPFSKNLSLHYVTRSSHCQKRDCLPLLKSTRGLKDDCVTGTNKEELAFQDSEKEIIAEATTTSSNYLSELIPQQLLCCRVLDAVEDPYS
ncbi:hypothetical protein L195_g010719 [Trifolium pratense]|uniref:Uncharacterized protein n=1 Tax=Trifolium pratense TaxID=57577 RepID=A0A2K3PFH1_TRIPR|nr:hypothetical protein L195_g010719 [Trifolium pratense]